MKFKKMVTKAGDIKFFKNSKVVSIEEVPEEALVMLDGDKTKEVEYKPSRRKKAKDAQEPILEATTQDAPQVDGAQEKSTPISDLSGLPATRRRWLSGKVYNLTQEEYQMTLGKLAQAIREKTLAGE